MGTDCSAWPSEGDAMLTFVCIFWIIFAVNFFYWLLRFLRSCKEEKK